MKTSIVTFAPRTILLDELKVGFFRSKIVKNTATFADIQIDGVSLFDRFELSQGKFITYFSDQFTQQSHDDFFNNLAHTGKETNELTSGRTPLYVCPFDGDPVCGVLACRIEQTNDTVRLYDFAFDADYTYEDNDDAEKLDGEFVFNTKQYREALRSLDHLDIPSTTE